MEYNSNGNSFIDLHIFLNKLNYSIYDITDIIRDSDNNIIQIDVLFVKMTSHLWNIECTGYPIPKYFQLETLK